MTSAPNILFLFSDQHSARIAGCYGDPVAKTPSIDRLAASGVTFDNCYTPSPICTPARMAMLTARYPHRQETWTNDDILPSHLPCFPHALALAGYRTRLAGRLHALGPDQLHGYDQRFVGDHSPNWPGRPRIGMGALEGGNSPVSASIRRSGAGMSVYQLLDQSTTEAALGALEAIKADGGDRPFQMTVGFMLPHAPYVAQPEDYAMFDGKVSAPALSAPEAEDDHPFLCRWRKDRELPAVDPADEMRCRTAYYALTWRLDRMIGEILTKLGELGLDENTLIIYASDHGDQLGERGLWWKHTFYDQSTKVPLILSWPGVLPGGERRSQLVDLLDVSATMIDAAGGPPLPNSNGRSFLPVAKDAECPWDDTVFSEYCMDTGQPWAIEEYIAQRMIREGDWKLNYYHGDPVQLFNLRDDPDELTDLACDPTHADRVTRLTARILEGWDPEEIFRKLKQRNADMAMIKAWAKLRQPDDVVRWHFEPEQNRLDPMPGAVAGQPDTAAEI